MSKASEQPSWDAREAFHRATMAVYADLGSLVSKFAEQRDLHVTLRVFDEHVAPYGGPEPDDPELVASLRHGAVRLRSSLAMAEELRGTHRQATRAICKQGGSFGGIGTTSHHDALIAAGRLLLDPTEHPVLRQQVLTEGMDQAAWTRLKENLESEFKLAQIEPPVPDESKSQPPDVLAIFNEMDLLWLNIVSGNGDDADEAYDALFGPKKLHEQFLALAKQIADLQERFRGEVRRIADFAITSGHEAAAIFAGRIAQFARARKRWIPQHRQDLRQAEAAGDKVTILRAQHALREGIRGFAKFMTPAFQGWDEHRAWMRRSIESELMAANGSQGGSRSKEEASSAKQEEGWHPSAHQQLVLDLLKRDGRLKTGVLWRRIAPKYVNLRAHQNAMQDLVAHQKVRKAGKAQAIEYWLP